MSNSNSFLRLTEQLKEIGFGSKSFEFSERLIFADGSFNVEQKGTGLSSFSLFHWMIHVSWFKFFSFVVVSYILVNLLFGGTYYLVGPEFLTESPEGKGLDSFLHCFYFSSQTLTTVGFGRISPTGNVSSIVAAFEAMVGVLGFAFATGILYGRFSKAKAKILFSDKVVISPYRGIKGFKFRIVNSRKNQLIDMSARVVYSYIEEEKDGNKKRRYRQLDLEIDFINLFPLPWTIVHPLSEDSPLYGKGVVDLSNEKAEFIIILKGYDDTFNQYVHQIHSYKFDEIVFDADFLPMFDATLEKSPVVYMDRISDFKKVV